MKKEKNQNQNDKFKMNDKMIEQAEAEVVPSSSLVEVKVEFEVGVEVVVWFLDAI